MGKWINHILDINIEINRSEKQTTTKTFKSMKRARITEVIGALQRTSEYYVKTGTLGKKLSINIKESTRVDEKTIRIIPFTGEN